MPATKTRQERRNELAAEIKDLAGSFHANEKKWKSNAEKSRWDSANAEYDQVVEGMDAERLQGGDVLSRATYVETLQNSPVGNPLNIGREDTHGRLSDRQQYNRGFVEDNHGRRTPILSPSNSFGDGLEPDRFNNEGIQDVATYLKTFAGGSHTEQYRAALSEGVDADGGYTVPRILSAQLIDLMRAKSRIMQAGASTIALDSQQTDFAKVASDPVPGWRSELGSVDESKPTFSKVTFKAQSLAVIVRASQELLEDSVNIGQALPAMIATALAQEVDRAALAGSGTAPEPTGVFNFSGINTVDPDTDGFLLSATGFAPLLDAELALLNKNIEADPTRPVITSPAVIRERNLMVDSTGQPLRAPAAIENWRYLSTTKVPNDITHGATDDTSWLVTGQWDNLVIGMRRNIRLQRLQERYADTMEVGFLASLRMDVAAWREDAFVKVVGIKATT